MNLYGKKKIYQGIASAANLIRSLRAIFSDTGVPVLLKTDGRPQFTSSALRRFLSHWGVEHRITSPYHPKANGYAEASVKIIKKLIMTTAKNGNLQMRMNSPVECWSLGIHLVLMADHQLKFYLVIPSGLLFQHIVAHLPKSGKRKQRNVMYLRIQAKQRYDSTARPLSHLKMGSYVNVQDHTTGLWNHPGVVVGIGSRRDYLIKMGSGSILWRNRKFLRPHRSFLPIYGSSLDATNTPSKPKDVEKSQDNSTAEVISKSIEPTPAPRRSLRHRKEPDRLQPTRDQTSSSNEEI
ncbi:uncharacterized protein LOC135198285 [Macrobrachium nipponense]|uniref:uncharacterized protein LOC135198285 n=1 Tax=Macrobrachium nipponense TaxID=159736 RepID=UPI0030C80BFB